MQPQGPCLPRTLPQTAFEQERPLIGSRQQTIALNERDLCFTPKASCLPKLFHRQVLQECRSHSS